MTKAEWQKIYEVLHRQLSDFLLAYPDAQRGRNKKIRDDADRKVESAIRLSMHYIRNNAEVYDLLTDGSNDDFGRTIFLDEFQQSRYFGHDMSEFLRKMKEKIESIKD